MSCGHGLLVWSAVILLKLDGGVGRDYLPLVVQDVVVPTYGIAGKHAVLSCFYSPVSYGIYSVKWYKNGLDFYSYLPGRPDPITIHPLDGVHVDVSRSSAQSVHLYNLSIDSTGRYRCEVSGEAPIFPTDSKYGDMLVVLVPQHGPLIQWTKRRYHPGEELSVNCTTEHTKPPTNLTLYINQKLVEETAIIRYPTTNVSYGYDHLHTTTLGLKYIVKRDDFESGRMRIKCAASIYDAYYKSVEISVDRLRRYRPRPRTEAPALDEAPGPWVAINAAPGRTFFWVWYLLVTNLALSMYY